VGNQAALTVEPVPGVRLVNLSDRNALQIRGLASAGCLEIAFCIT
jgi:hypothetical protein